jgi:hypothetical protein
MLACDYVVTVCVGRSLEFVRASVLYAAFAAAPTAPVHSQLVWLSVRGLRCTPVCSVFDQVGYTGSSTGGDCTACPSQSASQGLSAVLVLVFAAV